MFAGLAWPRGAPRCNIRPGHGAQLPDNLNVAVNKQAQGKWKVGALIQVKHFKTGQIQIPNFQVTLPGSFKGIILNSATEGRSKIKILKL